MNKLLSLDSNNLLKFIDNLDLDLEYDINIQDIRFLKNKMNRIIKSLDITSYTPVTYNEVNRVKENLKYSEFSDFLDFNFDKMYKHRFKFGSNELYIVYNNLDLKTINYISKIVFIFFEFFNVKNFSQQIILTLSNNKKTISNGILGAKNVNSGFTIIITSEIYLYRKEELIKVLIHELIHSTNNDLSENTVQIFNLKVKEYFNLNSILVNESFTEFRTCMLNLIFNISYYDYYNGTQLIYNIEEYLINEIKHSLVQTNKILDHNQIIDLSNITKYNENSNIFAYYVLKSILLHFSNIYFKDLITNKNNNLKLIQTVFSKKYLTIYNRDLRHIKNKLIEIRPETFIRNNLRMTLYEFNLNALKR